MLLVGGKNIEMDWCDVSWWLTLKQKQDLCLKLKQSQNSIFENIKLRFDVGQRLTYKSNNVRIQSLADCSGGSQEEKHPHRSQQQQR